MSILWPLVGCSSGDPLEGGYGFLDWNGNTWHPGVDLNAGAGGQADCGAAVVAPCEMLIVAAIHGVQNGFGNHVWALAGQNYLHFCHLETIGVASGWVSRGSVFATCGRTNGWPDGWPYCHLHFEVKVDRPPTWEFWPRGFAREPVGAMYYDPLMWLRHQSQEAVDGLVEEVNEVNRVADLEAELAALQADRDMNARKALEFEALLRGGLYAKRGRRYAPVSEADIQAAVARAQNG